MPLPAGHVLTRLWVAIVAMAAFILPLTAQGTASGVTLIDAVSRSGNLRTKRPATAKVPRWWGWRRWVMYTPNKRKPPSAKTLIPTENGRWEAFIPRGEDVTLETTDGLDLGAYWVPPKGKNKTVLIAGGSGGNRLDLVPVAKKLADRGLGVLVFDYRGFGGNQGVPSEAGLARDIRAARQFLTIKKAIRDDQLIYYGYSLGTAVVTELAAQHPPAKMVLVAPFTSVEEGKNARFPELRDIKLPDRFALTDHLSSIRFPTTVVYSKNDSHILPQLSKNVADEIKSYFRTVVELEGMDHLDPKLTLKAADYANELALETSRTARMSQARTSQS